MHIENLSRAGHVSLSVFKAASDVTSFKLAAILAKVGSKRNSHSIIFSGRITICGHGGRHPGSDLVWEVANPYLVALSHNNSSIDRIS